MFARWNGLLFLTICILFLPDFSVCRSAAASRSKRSLLQSYNLLKALYSAGGGGIGGNVGACQFQLLTGFDMGVGYVLPVDLEPLPFTDDQLAWFNKLHPVINSRPSSLVRKDIRQLTQAEWEDVAIAFWRLKRKFIDGVSAYDLFAMMHDSSYAPASSRAGPAQLPWHREFGLRMEQALYEANPDMEVFPYWDITLEGEIKDKTESIIWSPQRLGSCRSENGTETYVTDGSFADWTLPNFCSTDKLTRECGVQASSPGFTRTETEIFCGNDSFADMYDSFGDCMTIDHDMIHIFMGGTTLSNNVKCVVSDPVAWFFHAFVDMIWEDYRQNCQTTDLESDWPDTDTENHQAGDQLYPFTITNLGGLTNEFKHWVTYEKTPISCEDERHDQCGNTDYLFCSRKNTCESRVVSGGQCKLTAQCSQGETCSEETGVCEK